MGPEQNAEVARLESYEPMVEEITQPTTGSLQRLEAEALAMDKAHRLAKGLSATAMVPEHFQQSRHGDQAIWDLAAAILYGAELGLSAPQSAQNVFVVKGRPAVYARTMAAQVMHAGYKLEEVEASDEKVVWRAYRDTRTAESEWTIARASKAGYTRNERYQTNPQEMLRAKCIAEVCRILFPDVLLGMSYTVEELQLENVTVQRVMRQGGRGSAKLRELASQPEQEEQEEQSPDEQPAPPPQATGAQLVEIRKLAKARGVTGQALLGELAQFLQRTEPLAALQDLTQDEAGDVVAFLAKKPAAPQDKEATGQDQ